jgi:anti-sigma factor RsiW
MNHDEAAPLLSAYRDGELDLATCVKLEAHMANCPRCQQILADDNELVGLLQTEVPAYKPSPFLRTRIEAQLREKKADAPARHSWNPIAMIWTCSSVTVAALVVLGLAMAWSQSAPPVAREAIANHVRSLQVNHLMDVASTDQHTVKPWFAGKLDYSPQVIDLASTGYPLIGGRLDVLDHRNVAAIIYQRRKHYINLFIWPSDSGGLHERLYEQNGYHVTGWTRSGMNYLAVSELGEQEFQDFVKLIQAQTVDSRPGE